MAEEEREALVVAQHRLINGEKKGDDLLSMRQAVAEWRIRLVSAGLSSVEGEEEDINRNPAFRNLSIQ